MALTAEINLSVGATLSGSLDLETVTSVLAKSYRLSFASGTGAGQANNIWSDTRTLSSNTSESLDLYGSLANALGTTLNFARFKLLVIKSADANTTNLTIGNVTNGISTLFGAAAQSLILPPGGLFCVATGDATAWAVTDSTADLLKVANATGAAATYDIIIGGVA